MTAMEFHASLRPDGSVAVPADVASKLKSVESFRVVVLVPSGDEDDDEAWRRFGMEQFFKGYADSDAIYDDL